MLALDLGCGRGSFPREATSARVVRVDREARRAGQDATSFVQADAARLPFPDRTFAAVIANHSLEHFGDLNGALSEIGRVITPGGNLFVAVPDASTFTDRLYRWLARGGGHVNGFTSATEIAATTERATGLPHVATRLLCSSLAFLNPRNAPSRPPRRLLLLGGGREWSLFLYCWLSRRLDRWLNTRTSVYGWALYFGGLGGPIDEETWVNVCFRCGSGHAASALESQGCVGPRLVGLRTYRCPGCGARNPFADDHRALGGGWQ
jgi:SAM-dependent methyltransferase